MTERDFLIGVLFACDKSCSHAVTIYGNFIYDANEIVALPLCIEGLDYCSSTSNVRSEFVRFYWGYLIRYKGSKKQKLMSMMLHILKKPKIIVIIYVNAHKIFNSNHHLLLSSTIFRSVNSPAQSSYPLVSRMHDPSFLIQITKQGPTIVSGETL